ncbi:MAG: cell surface protein SprA [Bacteroidia bacterium]
MKSSYRVLLAICILSYLAISSTANRPSINYALLFQDSEKDSTKKDSLKYPIRDRKSNDFEKIHQFDLNDPDNVRTDIKYNPIDKTYSFQKKIGDHNFGSPQPMTFAEYLEYQRNKDQQNYFRQKSQATNFVRSSGILPDLFFDPKLASDMFGEGLIDIRPSGSAELIFGGNYNRVENPNYTARQQKNGNFDFKMKMQVNVTGQIGDRIKINTNYDTEATFEFENQTGLNWEGKENDILQSIELGNVSLPLNGSLIQGGQSLFGVKTKLQFGKLTMTAIATQQKGETRETEVNGGAQITKFNVQASDYDVNRHFFLSQYFANNYDNALDRLPVIQSNVLINYIEVWVTNRASNYSNTGNLVALMDLGESDPYNNAYVLPGTAEFPANEANSLFDAISRNPDATKNNLQVGVEYVDLTNARQLNTQEYTLNSQLGYISLNQALNTDEILAVAYEYSYNGVIYKVGEFARDRPPTNQNPPTLSVKMVKSTLIKTNLPTWNLMMKNIYSLGAYNMQTEDFSFNVVYADDKGGGDLGYLPVEPSETNWYKTQLNAVFKLDKMNRQFEAKPDGLFDLIEGVTIQASQGRIIFPMREPFGNFTRDNFNDPTGKNADYYSFDALYDSTKWDAEQDVSHDKFFLRGSYKGSSSNQIRLQCFNVPKGSVKVTANGSLLNEGVDYQVDYTIGMVTILNEGILGAGAVIKASCESNSLFNLQQKTLIGSRFDYKMSDKLLLGGTILHLTERPLTPKTNIGEEPLLNTIYGFDGAYNTKSRMLTRWVDKLPFIETKEESSIALTWEFAQIIPHKPLSIGDAERGTSFIDDFEGAETPYEIKNVSRWKLASVPQHQPDLFPNTTQGLIKLDNNRRGLFSWYTIDPVLQNSQDRMPEHLKQDVTQRSGHFVRSIPYDEPFPKKNIQQQQVRTIQTLDLAYYPKKRGPYNFTVDNLLPSGDLGNPESNWAGISRRIENTDFEAANYDYIEIWMMDPFVYEKEIGYTGPTNSGQLYLNLGSVSEDVLPDKKRSMENSLPTANSTTTAIEQTACGVVGTIQPIVDGFDNDPSARSYQDVGLDGLSDELELEFYKDSYLEDIKNTLGASSQAYLNAISDPAGDNFKHHRDPDYDVTQTTVLHRYLYYKQPDGNSNLDRLPDGTPKANSTFPDDEDINQDNTLDQIEEYFQYKIDLSQSDLVVGTGYVADSIRVFAAREDEGHKPDSVTYYQLKIPIRDYQKRVGGISNFKSIRFMRMFMTGFEDSVIVRLLEMRMIRADWRRYQNSLKFPPTIGLPPDPNDPVEFVVSTVNIEENSSRVPIKYVEPPGITRELDPTQPNQVLQNEQSLSLRVCELEKGDARGAFRVTEIDIRNYKNFKMFLHAEGDQLQNGDVWAFVRIGTDLENNYYEYQMPLQITANGAVLQDEIWPSTNNMEFALQEFYDLKIQREKSTRSKTTTYETTNSKGHILRVVGLPDLSQVRTMMLGVMNPNSSTGQEKLCTEVWFNEMRVTGISNKGGWAATARMVTKLADFARLNVSGNYTTIGFGGIDKALNERSLDQTFQYDISSNIELGKFFPQKSGITIPMFIGWNENYINPKYYPLNPDILYKQVLAAAADEDKKTIKETSQDYTSRYSLNFTNFKKNRTGGGKVRLWDIENFNTSYSYQRVYRRNQIVKENFTNTHRASLAYTYANRPKPWEPFKKIIRAKQLRMIKDFNFTLMPSSLNFQFDVDRRYGEMQNRSNDDFEAIVPRFYDKSFTLKRSYGARWRFTNNLKFNYNSVVDAWVEEPFGEIDTKEKEDSIRDNFFNFGTMRNFNQVMDLNYTVPFSKFKKLNWITATAKYAANYSWTTAPPTYPTLGNTIQNSQTITLNGRMNFTSFYNRSKVLRPFVSRTVKKKKKPKENKDDPDSANGASKNPDTKKKKQGLNPAVKGIGAFLLMIKQAQMTYTETNGTTLPGFSPDIQYLGQNFDLNTPSWPFIFGLQNPELRYTLAKDGHITTDITQNTRYMQLKGQNVTGSATLEPFRNFRITLNITKRTSNTLSSNFRYEEGEQKFLDLGLQEIGQYSISFMSWGTAFDKLGDVTQNYGSDAFSAFKDNRLAIAQTLQKQEFSSGLNKRFEDRIGEVDPSTGFPVGYGQTQQDVILFSFLSAYGGTQSKILSPFKRLPAPAWQISYNGLKDLFGLKKYFTNISIQHAYNSTLNLNSYYSELTYGADPIINDTSNLKSKYTFQQGVSLVERMTPVLGIDVTMKNGLTLKLAHKRDRNITLFMNTFQMIEQRNMEWVIGAGFVTKGIKLPIKYRGSKIYLENNLNFRFDLSIRDGVTVRRDIELGTNTAQAGNRIFSIKPNIDYKINDNTNLRMFYNRTLTEPKNSQSFRSAITDFGISIRYTLQ